ncbi:MAG: GspE family protein, partial [Pseudomonadota bacterium]|nr:GspE family protein [Pseudomonadota bacterium]
KQLSESGLRVCSVEDPIEVELDGILQTQVHSQRNLSFAKVLRAFLRQDPDVIMIGEIRDAETAKIAVQAALTGHLVIASIHADTAIDVIRRLVQLGAQQTDVTAALRLLISQRLLAQAQGGVKVIFELLPWPERLRGYSESLAQTHRDTILKHYQLPSLQALIQASYRSHEDERFSTL